VLVAHFFLAHASRASARCRASRAARDEADALPLGSGALPDELRGGRGSARPDLGFSRVVANSIDASSERDFAATFLYAVRSRWCTSVGCPRISSSSAATSTASFELSDALSTGSSMMPQKKNPDPLELVRGKTGRAIGDLMGLLVTTEGLPSGYNKDLQEDKHAVFDAEDTLDGCLAVVRAVVSGLTLNRARAGAAASGLLLATDVADYLVGRGCLSAARMKSSARLVRKLVAEERDFSSLG
jgi:argininosuccinate lyase